MEKYRVQIVLSFVTVEASSEDEAFKKIIEGLDKQFGTHSWNLRIGEREENRESLENPKTKRKGKA